MTSKRELRALKALGEKVEALAVAPAQTSPGGVDLAGLTEQVAALGAQVVQINEKLDALLQAQTKKAK